MLKKFTFAFIILAVVTFVGVFVSSYFFSPKTYYALKHTVTKDGMTSYINEEHRLVFEYPNNYRFEEISEESFSLLGGGDTKPYIVRLKSVPQQSFQEWYEMQSWPGNEKNYWFVTTTNGQPVVVSEITEVLYTMARPGRLVTIENALSSYQNYHSHKILWDFADSIKPLPGVRDKILP